MTKRTLNDNWDSLLTPAQRKMMITPGFGITSKLPYLHERDVKKIMMIIEYCLKHIDLKITQK